MKYLLLFLLLAVSAYSQTGLDKLETWTVYDEDENMVKKGEILYGTVIAIEASIIKFKLQGTELTMDIPKTDVRKLTLSTGQVMTFAPSKTEVLHKDSGGMSGWAVVGIVLTVLFTIALVNWLVSK